MENRNRLKTPQYALCSVQASEGLDPMRDERALAEAAKQHGMNPRQITDWKNQLLEHAAGMFGADQAEGPMAERRELHTKLGQQAQEIDFLSGALGETGLLSEKK